MSERISIEAVPNMPHIVAGDDIGEIIVDRSQEADIELKEHDILCIASKAVSSAEDRIINLNEVKVSHLAYDLHEKIPRKDPRIIQKIIDETEDPSGSRLDIDTNYIAGWLPNGMRLTSSGVDKLDKEHVILLPEDPDASARKIGEKIFNLLGIRVGVIVTDSDGRVDKAGSTQVAIGLYGVPALRRSESIDEITSKSKVAEETLSDLLAASAALIMGQRGIGKPVVTIRGVDYQFDENSRIINALSRVPEGYAQKHHG